MLTEHDIWVRALQGMADKSRQGEGITSLYEVGRGDWYLKLSIKRGQGGEGRAGEELGKAPGCCHIFFIKNKG